MTNIKLQTRDLRLAGSLLKKVGFAIFPLNCIFTYVSLNTKFSLFCKWLCNITLGSTGMTVVLGRDLRLAGSLLKKVGFAIFPLNCIFTYVSLNTKFSLFCKWLCNITLGSTGMTVVLGRELREAGSSLKTVAFAIFLLNCIFTYVSPNTKFSLFRKWLRNIQLGSTGMAGVLVTTSGYR